MAKIITFLKENVTHVAHGAVASVSKVDKGLRINWLNEEEESVYYDADEWEVVVIKND